MIEVRNDGRFPVLMRLGVTPVLIPNTMVKPYTADDTALATVWKSRWMPDQIYSYNEIRIPRV